MNTNRRILLQVLCFLCAFSAIAFDANDIISPSQGTWANRQALVLDGSDGSELYYSLTGSDPLESGFAYDGPVLIDETGSVTLNITAVNAQGVRSDFTINYTVEPVSVTFTDPHESLFVQALSSNPIRKYISGNSFDIPARFRWCLGNPIVPTYEGKGISLSALNCVDRYVACTVTEGTAFWHFVLHVVPQEQKEQVLLDADVPFTLEDWSTFVFTGDKLIYQIDDAFWTASKEPLVLDRSVNHTVRWQSMNYEFGNPVHVFTLPAKPELTVNRESDGSVSFSVAKNANFTLGPARSLTEDCVTSSLPAQSRLVCDTFFDDSLYAVMKLGVYYRGVYQGDISCPFFVDRKIPQVPIIASSEKAGYARNRVLLSISGESDSEIYYAVSKPMLTDSGLTSESEALFSSVEVGDYSLYDGSEIVLSSRSRKTTYYKVCAYAKDVAGNQSARAEYHVVVDEFNFYLAPSSSALNEGAVPDGSYANPFTSFAQAQEALSRSSFMRLHVLGDIVLPHGDTVISTPIYLVGSDSHIIIPDDARLVIKESDFSAEGCIFERTVPQYASSASDSLFVVDGGSLTLYECELVGTFAADGVLIDAANALIGLSSSGFTVQGASYAAVLSGTVCDVSVSNCRLTSSAQTAVTLTLNKSTLACSLSEATIITHLGRCIELVDSTALVNGCVFSAQRNDNFPGSVAIWKDIDSVVTAYANEEGGF